MHIETVIPGYLYAASDIFPEDYLNQINGIDWASRPYMKVPIGQFRRRQLEYDTDLDGAVNDYCFDHVKNLIEHHCHIKFIKDSPRSLTYWLDEPGFKPAMHIDGDLPSALQIYLQCAGRTDLGTAFYRTENREDLLHEFKSFSNSGYIMLNQPEPDRPKLWHDMTASVPDGVLRLCLYVTFGNYVRL